MKYKYVYIVRSKKENTLDRSHGAYLNIKKAEKTQERQNKKGRKAYLVRFKLRG